MRVPSSYRPDFLSRLFSFLIDAAMTRPEAGAVGVPLTATLVITFNKELLAGSEERVSFRLDLLQGPYEPVMVPGQVERQGRSLRLTPDEPLEEGVIYQARVLGATSYLGERMDTPYRWAFEASSILKPRPCRGYLVPNHGEKGNRD
jgi:hypothetical protein